MENNKRGIIKLLNELGVPASYTGYNYIVEESLIILDKTSHNKKVVIYDTYKEVADKFNTNIFNVEKDIRWTIESTFKTARTSNIDKLFYNVSNYYQDRPTNKLFLLTIVNNYISEL